MDDKKVVRVKLVRHRWPDEIAAQRKKRRNVFLVVLALIVCFTGGFITAGFIDSGSINGTFGDAKLDSIYEIMRNKWYFGKDDPDLEQHLIDGAIRGMVDNEVDLHTMYMDPDMALQFMSSLEGEVVGIGVQYQHYNGLATISRVLDNSPAQKAGLQHGDSILKVDGQSVKDLTRDEVREAVQGEEGTKVVLTLQRDDEVLDVEIVRQSFDSSVYSYVHDDIGVLEIISFAERSAVKVGDVLENFKQAGIKNLVIDMRDDGGGYLTTLVDIASYFLPSGSVVFSEHTRDNGVKEFVTRDMGAYYEFEHIVILVNGNTASAAEVLTATLKEHLGAKVIGTQTYGKGTVQTSIPFVDGSIIKYTIAQWYTPDGNIIDGVGITPDIMVEVPQALSVTYPLQEGLEYEIDSVSQACLAVQHYLKFLGYTIERVDGYFDLATQEAIQQFSSEHMAEVQSHISDQLIRVLYSNVRKTWQNHVLELDPQLIKAFEVVYE